MNNFVLQIVSCFVVMTMNVFAAEYNFDGFYSVNQYCNNSSITQGLKDCPRPFTVEDISQVVCLVEITHDGEIGKTRQSGVLISSNLVISAMHGFARYDAGGSEEPIGTPCSSPNKVRVYFNYKTGQYPSSTDPGWINVVDWDPIPTINFQINHPMIKDFIVLKLNKNVNLINYPKIDRNSIVSSPQRPIFIHHPKGNPLHISFDTKNKYVIPINNPISYSISSDGEIRGCEGSSGGGVFWCDNLGNDINTGSLIGLISGFYRTQYWDGINPNTLPYASQGPRARNAFDNLIGAKRLLPLNGMELGSYISPTDINTIWSCHNSFPAATTTTYKYKDIHTAENYIWYNDGTLSNGGTFTLPLDKMSAAPSGKYKMFIKLKKSIYPGSLTSSANKVDFYLDNNNTTSLYNAMKIGSVSDGDFYTRLLQGAMCISCNDNYAYSNLEEFEFGPIDLSGSNLRFGTQYLKFATVLNDAATQKVSGLSVHSVRIEFIDEDGDNIPWFQDNCPATPNPPETWTDINGNVHVNEQKDTDLDGKGDACDDCKTDPTNTCTMNSQANECRNITNTFVLDINSLPSGHAIRINWGDNPNWKNDLSHDITELKDKWLTVSHTYSANGYYPVKVYEFDNPGGAGTMKLIDEGEIIVNCPNQDVLPKIELLNSDRNIITTVTSNANLGIDLIARTTNGRVTKWIIDYGDGSNYVYECKYQDYPTDNIYMPFKHTYSKCGNYNFKITAIGTKPEIVTESAWIVNAYKEQRIPTIWTDMDWINGRTESGVTIKIGLYETIVNRTDGTAQWTLGNGLTVNERYFTRFFKPTDNVFPVTVTYTNCGGAVTKTIQREQMHPCVWFDQKIVESTNEYVTYEFSPKYNLGGDIKSVNYNDGEKNIPTLKYPSDFKYRRSYTRKAMTYQLRGYANAYNDIYNTGGQTLDIVINSFAPVVDFSIENNNLVVNKSLNFTSINTGGQVNSWYWDFGDGSTSTLQNPSHKYSKPGKYTVILKAIGPEFNRIKVKSDCVTVQPDITPIIQLLLD